MWYSPDFFQLTHPYRGCSGCPLSVRLAPGGGGYGGGIDSPQAGTQDPRPPPAEDRPCDHGPPPPTLHLSPHHPVFPPHVPGVPCPAVSCVRTHLPPPPPAAARPLGHRRAAAGGRTPRTPGAAPAARPRHRHPASALGAVTHQSPPPRLHHKLQPGDQQRRLGHSPNCWDTLQKHLVTLHCLLAAPGGGCYRAAIQPTPHKGGNTIV